VSCRRNFLSAFLRVWRNKGVHLFCVDSAADAGDAVPLNIDVQSYKKLLEKNLLNDLSSQTCADTLPMSV